MALVLGQGGTIQDVHKVMTDLRNALGGAGAARFRIELYLSGQNLLNRANYVGYSGVITSPFFGQPTNVMNPRELQAGIRFGF